MKGKANMKHFSLRKCLRKPIWHGDTLQCSCGRKLAIRYMINNKMKVYVNDEFKKHIKEILARKDTQKITGKSDLLGNLGNEEWEEILRDIRQRKTNT